MFRKSSLIFLVVASLWNAAHGYYDEVIHIGVILEEGFEYLQWAFNISIDKVNSDPTLLPNFKLRTSTAIIPKDDAYTAMMTACEWISNGVAAIFGPQSQRSVASVQAAAESVGIPLFPGRWEYRSYSSNTTAHLYPHADTKGFALREFIKDRNWRRFAVIYSDSKALIRLNPVLQDDVRRIDASLYKEMKPEVSIWQINEVSNYKKLFKDLKMKNLKNFVIDCPTEHVKEILIQAEEMGMISLYHNYLFTSLDAHVVDLTKFQPYHCNITIFRIVNYTRTEELFSTFENNIAYNGIRDKVKLYLNKTQFAAMYDAVLHFANALQSLQFNPSSVYLKVKPMTCFSQDYWEQGKIIVDAMKEIRTEGLTNYVMLDDVGYRSDFMLKESRLTPNGMILEGVWNKTGFTSLRNFTKEKEELADVLAKKVLRVTSIATPPYLKVITDPVTGEKTFTGHSVDLVDYLAKQAKFNYTFQEVKDKKYGSYEKGEWNGMVGELVRGEADLIVADLTITTQRQEVLDFAQPYMDLGISILFKKSDQKEENLFSFMSPFSAGVWFYMATATLGVTLILYVLGRFTPYEWLNPHPCDVEPEELENQFTLAETAWVVVGCLLQQGGDIEPKAMSTRMISGYWWFFTLLMVSSYTANLAAFLTAGRMEATIKSADDLVAQQKIQYGCVKGGSTQMFFKKAEASLYSRMWSNMEDAEPSVFMGGNPEGIERVLMGNYAFFMESTTIEYQTANNCQLTKVGGQLDSKSYGIAVPQGSLIRETLSFYLLKMKETGVNNMLKDKWWKGETSCPKDEESSDTLGLENLGGVFLILLIGLPLACIAVVGEFIWEIRKVPRNKREPICKELYMEIKSTVTGKNTVKQAPSEEDDEEKIISKASSSSSSSTSSPSGNTSKSTSKVSKKS